MILTLFVSSIFCFNFCKFSLVSYVCEKEEREKAGYSRARVQYLNLFKIVYYVSGVKGRYEGLQFNPKDVFTAAGMIARR